MTYRNILLCLMTAILLSAGVSANGQQTEDIPINLIPMYGYPGIEKTAAQKQADERFIKSVTGTSGSREKASKEFAAEGWRYWNKGDAANAMRRFNQSWLLDPNNYISYWGFGALLMAQRKAAEASTHYEKSLSLIEDDGERPRLLTDASRAYLGQGLKATDKMKSVEFFGKAKSLINEALELDPQYGNAYRAWALVLYTEGNYKEAWDMVKKSRSLGGRDFSSGFIAALTKKMPEPK